MVKGTAIKCTHCYANLTDKRRPGIKCTDCVKWIHQTCAKLPVGATAWTCGTCGTSSGSTGAPSLIPRRSSLSISRRVSTGSQFATRSVSHQKNVNSTNTCTMEIQLETLLKEVDNLKSMNNDVLGSLAKLTELTTLLAGFRDENVLLRQTNERLIAENRQLRLSLRAVENKQTNTRFQPMQICKPTLMTEPWGM